MTVLWNSCVLCLLFYLILINLDQNKSEDNKEWIDPDVKLCKELTIDAAVKADNGSNYIFKDDYYWPINSETGLSGGYGRRINENWPNLSTPIDAAFTVVDSHGQWSTAFIKNKTWFLYLRHFLIEQGLTTDWINFTEYPIEAAFTYFDSPVDRKFKHNPVYFLFNSSFYSKYNVRYLKNMSEINITSKTWTLRNILYFLESDYNEPYTLSQHLPNITAVLSNKQHLIFFGSGKYCRANINNIAPVCKVHELAPFLKCPRNPRPTTTTTPSTITTEATTNASTIQTETDTTEPTTSYRISSFSTTDTIGTNTIETEKPNETKSSDNSDNYIWIIIISVIIVIVIICSVIFAVFKTNNKKTTNSKPLANKLAKPDNSHEKSYSVKTLNSSGVETIVKMPENKDKPEDIAEDIPKDIPNNIDTETQQIMTRLKESNPETELQIQ